MAQTDSNLSPTFSDFPEDVQFCIFSFLSPTEIANFACTSKRFSPICQNDSKLWYSICDRRWGAKTQIKKWGNGKISYKLLYKTLNKWENLIGFWRRCGQSQQKQSPALVFFEWGASFLSGYSVSPSQNGGYGVIKAPFLFMSVSPEGEIVNYVDPSGELRFQEMADLIAVYVNFIGDMHFSVEENVDFLYPNLKGECSNGSGGDDVNVSTATTTSNCNGFECGSPGSLPETSDMYEYYANRMSPGADRAMRKLRRKKKEKQGRKKWETEHFLKIVDSSPTLARPLQGLWKGLCDDMKLEFYLVAYDGVGISCRRVGDLSERLSSSKPVFWTSNLVFVESGFSPEEDYLFNSRTHVQPPVTAKDMHFHCPLMDTEMVSRTMYINSSYDLVIPGLGDASANPWRVEGRIWEYKNGTFGFGFLGDNFIIDLKHIAQNGCLLDTIEERSSD
ncbi:F-box protein At3g12350 [Mercurialis annua]|uniref:F-box protein At3g12350 n=1 Tax=Mercurialis annua TaxID=3986 RepID=UPI00215E4E68|nr:F-box protein At3g12350 [Mercurialis annua]